MHRYLGTVVDTKSEVEMLAEIKKIAVITRSNLVNVDVRGTGARRILQILSGKDSGLGK